MVEKVYKYHKHLPMLFKTLEKIIGIDARHEIVHQKVSNINLSVSIQ